MITKDREYRSFDFETTTEYRATGTPVVFNSPTVIAIIDGVECYEVIDSRAFDECDMSDVVLVENHTGKVAAKTKNNTLDLTVRSTDVFMDADLSKNARGREMHEDIKNGFFDKMSFAFHVLKDKYDKQTRTRTILEIDKLFDVSVVDRAAYNQTSVQARSFFDMEIEKERMEIRMRDEKKKKLALLLKLGKEI